jgi:hypothetical protein
MIKNTKKTGGNLIDKQNISFMNSITDNNYSMKLYKKTLRIFALVSICITVFTACDREESNLDDLISGQIIARICEANTKLFAETEISVSCTKKDYFIFGTTLQFEQKLEVNLSAKKSLFVQELVGIYTDFDYYDETTHYLFMGKTEADTKDSLSSEKISTGYWKYYTWELPYLNDKLVKNTGKWKEEDGRFVADNLYPVIEEYKGSKYFVTLSENNRYLKIEVKSSTGKSLESYNFSYTANPVFPAGYQPTQFPAVKQYSINVNWGDTYGADTYYTSFSPIGDENRKYFSTGRIDNFGETPEVTGKLPLLYYDEACTQMILDDSKTTSFFVDYNYDESTGYYWFFNGYLTSETDGTTVYVQWEDSKTVYTKYGNR